MKQSMNAKIYKLIALFLCLILVTSFTNVDIVEEVRSIIKEYYGGGSISSEVLTANTVQGILNALGDPYSDYLTSVEFNELVNSINMEFVGIGITVEEVPGGILVLSVVDDSGALQAGIMPGDIIISADGISLSGKSLETCIRMLRGEEGTKVELTVMRDSIVFTVDVVRSRLDLPTVEWETINNKVGYIRINSFGKDTSIEFASVLNYLSDINLTGYIIDLRNNSGGFIDVVLEIAGFFIGDNKAVDFKGASDVSFSYNAIPQAKMIDKPVVFLANQYSASASELLLAAVKDYKKGLIIGEKTFGKGSMQDFFLLSNNDILKLTVARFLSPYGNPVNKVGVNPDIEASEALSKQAALLLLSGTVDIADKTGLIKYSSADMEYVINLKDVRTEANWQAFIRIIDGFKKNGGKLRIGNSKGWSELPMSFWDKPYMLFYPDYKELPKLVDVPVDKQFTITFSKPCTADLLSKEDIELIYSTSGKRVKLSYKQIDECKIAVIPTETLEIGQSYYLVINPGTKDKWGCPMPQGSIVEVQVR